MDQLHPEQLAILLPTLSTTITQLQTQLHPAHPTRLLHLHAPFQPDLTSVLLRALLRSTQHVFVDCITCHTPRLIYDVALNALAQWRPRFSQRHAGALNWDGQLDGFHPQQDGPSIEPRVWDTELLPEESSAKGALAGHANDSLAAFIEGLQTIFELDQEPKFLVFERAERLSTMSHAAATSTNAIEPGVHDGAFLAALSRLGELTGKPITPIFVSQLDHHAYQPPMGRALQPTDSQIIDVPPLNRPDYVGLLCHLFQPDPNSKLSQEAQTSLFPEFVALVYDTFSRHLSSADTLQELARLASGDLWSLVQSLVIEHGHQDLPRLLPKLRSAITKEQERLGQLVSATLHTDEASTGAAEYQFDVFMTPTKRKKPREAISKILRLSISASFLLIAAYLASYNHARTDVRMLAVEAEEQGLGSPSKKKGSPSKKRKGSPRKLAINRVMKGDPQRLLGPKPFAVERLLAIFDCIKPQEVETATDSAVHSQLASLISLRLVSRTTARTGVEPGIDALHGVKLKVNVTWDVIQNLSRRYDFNVADRMWDHDP